TRSYGDWSSDVCSSDLGTNKISGMVYEYFQNRNLNATGQEFKRQGISKPRFDQNRFGASIGGPIIPNKWFYFGNFEYAPLGQARSEERRVGKDGTARWS